MKYPNHYILFYCFSAYMSDEELKDFKKILARSKSINVKEKGFIEKLTRVVPLERLKDKPQRWQDIWIYNYITYD